MSLIANAKERFRDSIANTTAFRTWDGASYSVDQAKARIYFDALRPPADNVTHTLAELAALRPFAVVYMPAEQGVSLRHVANGPGHRFTPHGTLMARFERAVPTNVANDPGAADRQIENMLGPLLMSCDANAPGLAELAGQAGYLAITALDCAGPFRSTKDERPGIGDCQWFFVQADWGVRA